MSGAHIPDETLRSIASKTQHATVLGGLAGEAMTREAVLAQGLQEMRHLARLMVRRYEEAQDRDELWTYDEGWADDFNDLRYLADGPG